MTEYTLALEGATYAGSVALLRGSNVLTERTLADTGIPSREGREERLLPSVAECLDEAGIRPAEIARVVCGAGPGSFTSLRIAASVGKGIAVGVGCPMYSVSSLLLSVAGASSLARGFYLSVLPAMRNEWYAMAVERREGDSIIQRGEAALIAADQLTRTAAQEGGAALLGPGQEIDSRPHARGVAVLLGQIISAGPVRIETWEPEYGRLAEAQVRWETAHGRSLGVSG